VGSDRRRPSVHPRDLSGRSLLLCDYAPDDDSVGLLDLAGARFEEPFFVHTMAARLRATPRPLELAGDRREIVDVLAGQHSLPLRGALFHTGRCGSTLAANVLSALGSVLTLKEPPFVSSISTAFLAAPDDPGGLDERVGEAMRHLLPATTPAQESAVLKFTSWNVLSEAAWSRAVPGCPRAFIWRPCADVLESIAATPAGWADGRESSIALAAFDGGRWSLRQAGLDLPEPLATAAAAWLCTAAKGVELGRAGALVLPYARLQEDLAGAMADLCAHFAIPASARQLQVACQVRRTYAKDPAGRLPFSEAPERDHLDPSLRRAIDRIAGDIERTLSDMAPRP